MADVDVSLSISDSEAVSEHGVELEVIGDRTSKNAVLTTNSVTSEFSDVEDFNEYSSFSDSEGDLSEHSDSPISLINPTKVDVRDEVPLRRVSSIGLLSVVAPSTSNLFEVSECGTSTPTEEYQTSDRSTTSSPEYSPPRHISSTDTPSQTYTPNRTVAQTCHCDLGSCDTITGSVREPDYRSSSRLSYLSRALAMARPTSPPPPYNTASTESTTPTVLALRSYFGFTPVRIQILKFKYGVLKHSQCKHHIILYYIIYYTFTIQALYYAFTVYTICIIRLYFGNLTI